MRKKLTIALSGVFAALALVSIGWAAVPDGGTVHGCYDKNTGALRVFDRQTNVPKSCTAKELPLDWNQQGPPGADGAPGAPDPATSAYVGRFGSDTGNAASAVGAPCTLGQVLLTASTVKTAGGVPANGQLLPIAQNFALFALLGTTYGGNGQTTFALPDLRPVAPNHMTYSICINGEWPA
jgi:Phage Tail Collar Domain